MQHSVSAVHHTQNHQLVLKGLHIDISQLLVISCQLQQDCELLLLAIRELMLYIR